MKKCKARTKICRRVCHFLLSIHEEQSNQHQCDVESSDKLLDTKNGTEKKQLCKKSTFKCFCKENATFKIKNPILSLSSSENCSWQLRLAISAMKKYLTKCEHVFENIESICEK